MAGSSNQPPFWDARYRGSETPWDFGGVPAELKAFLMRKLPAGQRVLIPGCGAGYEVRAFATVGHDVTALDFSAAAVEEARRNAGAELAERILQADFFTAPLAPASFDLIYERAFLCSIDPDRREEYARRIASLLKPGGLFVGYFFYKNTALEDGPPHGLKWGESDELFAPYFLLTRDIPATDSLPVFAGRERWQEQRRTAHSASA